MSDPIASVLRAGRRSAATARTDLGEGFTALATIASIAPWFGLLGTVFVISMDTFKGCGCEKSAGMAAVADELSVSLWPAALGLAVALMSLWFLRRLQGELAGLALEMECAVLALGNQLSMPRRVWITQGPIVPEIPPERRRLPGAAPAALAAIFLPRLLELARDFLRGWPSQALDFADWKYALFVFALSLAPAHFFWARVLRRRRGGLFLSAALLTMLWRVLEATLGIRLL